MKYCINCGKKIKQSAKFCSYCGTKQPGDKSLNNNIYSHKATKKRPYKFLLILGAIFVLLFLIVVGAHIHNTKPSRSMATYKLINRPWTIRWYVAGKLIDKATYQFNKNHSIYIMNNAGGWHKYGTFTNSSSKGLDMHIKGIKSDDLNKIHETSNPNSNKYIYHANNKNDYNINKYVFSRSSINNSIN